MWLWHNSTYIHSHMWDYHPVSLYHCAERASLCLFTAIQRTLVCWQNGGGCQKIPLEVSLTWANLKSLVLALWMLFTLLYCSIKHSHHGGFLHFRHSDSMTQQMEMLTLPLCVCVCLWGGLWRKGGWLPLGRGIRHSRTHSWAVQRQQLIHAQPIRNSPSVEPGAQNSSMVDDSTAVFRSINSVSILSKC